jgi:hypothetical protein
VTTVHAVFKRAGVAALRGLDNLIELGKWDAMLSASECGALPKPGDTITRDGAVLRIVESDQAKPAGMAIVYFVKLEV